MYEFKIQSIIGEVDLTTVEGSARGLRLAAPVVAGIRDEVIRGGYVVKLATMLGLEDGPVRRAVSQALRELRSGAASGPGGAEPVAQGGRRGPGGQGNNGGRGGPGGAPAASRGVLQPDGSWLLPDGTYFHQPEPEPKRGGWKRDEGRGGSRGNRGDWQQRNGWQRNGPAGPGSPAGQGGQGGQGGLGGYGWTDHEPPPEDVPPPPDDDLPHDAYVTAPGSAPTAGPAPRRFQRPKLEAPNPGDPIAAVERQALECMLQVPRLVPPVDADDLNGSTFQVPAYRAVHDAIRAAGGMAVATGMTGSAWVTTVQDFAPDAVVPMITELAVAPLPADREDEVAKYAASVVLKVAETALVHRIGDLRSRVQRMGADEDASAVFAELIAAENDRRLLRDRINGNT
jgi:DNA primase